MLALVKTLLYILKMEYITKILLFELKLMASKSSSIPKVLPVNYLCDEGKVPKKRADQFY